MDVSQREMENNGSPKGLLFGLDGPVEVLFASFAFEDGQVGELDGVFGDVFAEALRVHLHLDLLLLDCFQGEGLSRRDPLLALFAAASHPDFPRGLLLAPRQLLVPLLDADADGGGLYVFLQVEAAPVVEVVVGEAHPVEQFPEELPEELVVGLLLELEGAAVVHVGGELDGEALALDFDGSGHLLLLDLLVLLRLVVGLHTLPGERPLRQVEQDVADGLEVVPPALLHPEVRVDRRVPHRPSEGPVLLVGDVLVALGVPVLLAEPEVDEVEEVGLVVDPHEEVLGLDVPVHVVEGVEALDPRNLSGAGRTIWSVSMSTVFRENLFSHI